MPRRAVPEARYPGRAPIDAYGSGGFRFAEMSHVGSILLLPSGIYAWPVAHHGDLVAGSFGAVFKEAAAIDFLLLGTGQQQHFPSSEIRSAFEQAGVGLEVMDTGAAARTYNVLLGESRAIAAALIAVD